MSENNAQNFKKKEENDESTDVVAEATEALEKTESDPSETPVSEDAERPAETPTPEKKEKKEMKGDNGAVDVFRQARGFLQGSVAAGGLHPSKRKNIDSGKEAS
jgi:hypothetical protein